MNFPSQMYIAGELTDGASTKAVINPATKNWVATVATAGLRNTERALQAARAAVLIWGATSIAKRRTWTLALCDEVIAQEDFLRNYIHYEMGKPWSQTEKDWDQLAVSLEYYAEDIARFSGLGLTNRTGTHTHRMVYEPAGVVLAFLAWNFPLLNLAFKMGQGS